MIELRGYQERAVKALPRLLARHRRVVAVSPTASGKTVIGAALIQKMRGKRVLWIAHRIELLRQAREKLIAAGVPEHEVGILSGPDKRNEGARVLVASVSMLTHRDVKPADLIVVDEAHRIAARSYQTAIEAMPDAWVLGLTATPWRLDGKPLEGAFDHMLVVAGQTELIVDDFIAKPITYGIPRAKARGLVAGVRTSRGDYDSGALGRAMGKRRLMGDIVKESARLAPGEKTIVFAVNREHGRALAQRFKKAGRATEYLDGETSASDRAAILQRLAKGATEVVVNIDVLSEGFDCPAVKCIVLARPTRSLTRFLQYVGRAARPYKGRRPIVIDHAGNCWLHGLPEQEREWSLTRPERGHRTGDGPVKQCPECEAMIPALARECPECGAEQPRNESGLNEEQAQLEKLAAAEKQRQALIERLKKLAKERGLPDRWVRSTAERISA